MSNGAAREQPTEFETPTGQGGVPLDGLDGGTPLGFFASLGALRVLTERRDNVSQDRLPVRLSWQMLDAWRPVVHGVASLDELVTAVYDDAVSWANAPLLGFRYVKVEKNRSKPVGGLKAPLAVFRGWLGSRREARDETSLEYASALMNEEVSEEVEKTKVTTSHQQSDAGIPVAPDAPFHRSTERSFFDFTARNAQFLEQLEAVRGYLTRELVRAALERGEPDMSAPRSMDWDPASDTPGAIYTGYQRGFLPVHEWLAFRGLAYFPIAVRGGKIRNTGCTGRRLDGEFCWPLWDAPAAVDGVRSLVSYPGLSSLNREARAALGIATVLCTSLTKKADGRSGTFSPSRPA